MARRCFLIFWLLLTATGATTQTDFRTLDSAMYSLTRAAEWKAVIRMGEEALDEDIDYFYLRMRMGLAYYHLNNYRASVRQMEKARLFAPGNSIVNVYLYNAYQLSGRRNEAPLLSGSLNEKQRAEAGIDKEKIISSVYLETGPEISDNFDRHGKEHLPRESVYSEQDLYGNSYYTHLGLRMQVHPRIGIYAGYSNLQIQKRMGLQYAWNQPDSTVMEEWGFSRYFPSQVRVETISHDYTLRQNSLYLNATILPGRGWSFTPAIHYVNVNTQQLNVVNNTQLVLDTAYYISALDSAALFDYGQAHFDLEPQALQLSNMVVSMALNKQVSVFDLGVFASWSNLNEQDQYQYGISATYYPLGNLHFYGTSTVKALHEGETHMVIGQMLGARVFSFLWAEAFGWLGNLSGTNESNAFIVYNITDNINLKTGVSLTFVISPAIQLSARYQYLQKESFRTVFDEQGRMKTQALEYINQSIIGGIKWTL
jgi:hypothetical protein